MSGLEELDKLLKRSPKKDEENEESTGQESGGDGAENTSSTGASGDQPEVHRSESGVSKGSDGSKGSESDAKEPKRETDSGGEAKVTKKKASKKKAGKKKASKKASKKKAARHGGIVTALSDELADIEKADQQAYEVDAVKAEIRRRKRLRTQLTKFSDTVNKFTEQNAQFLEAAEKRLEELQNGESDE